MYKLFRPFLMCGEGRDSVLVDSFRFSNLLSSLSCFFFFFFQALRTNDEGIALYEESPWMSSSGPCFSTLKNASIA